MPQTKRNSGLAQSAKQRQKFCYGPPPVYQDVSTRQDWPVNKAIAHLPVRLKGKSKHISGNSLSPLGAQNKDIGAGSQTLLTGVRLLCDAGNKWLWRVAELCVLLETSVVTVRFEGTCYGCSESYSGTVHVTWIESLLSKWFNIPPRLQTCVGTVESSRFYKPLVFLNSR